MKHLICILLIVSLFSSCEKSIEDKAKDIIKQHLKETLDDWDSYEPITFSSIDSAFSVCESEPIFIAAEKAKKQIESPFKVSTAMLEAWRADTVKYAKAYQEELSTWRALNDSISSYQSTIDNLKANFSPKLEGFTITHKFRCNNENGVKQIHKMIFYIDSLLSKVVETEEK